jgi:hypothetical protein
MYHVVRDGASFSVLFSLLDPVEPFEWDPDNLPHLVDNPYYGPDDALDVFHDDPECYEDDSEGSGDWLLVGQVPGSEILMVPIAQSRYSGFSKVRPITVFPAPEWLKERYWRDKEGWHG